MTVYWLLASFGFATFLVLLGYAAHHEFWTNEEGEQE